MFELSKMKAIADDKSTFAHIMGLDFEWIKALLKK